MARTAEQLHADGVRYLNEGRLAPAKRSLMAARRATTDINLRARIDGTLGFAMGMSGDIAGGQQLCRQALQTPGISERTFAIVAGQVGTLAERAGQLDEAHRWLTRALAALDDESEELAILAMNRSVLEMQRRQFQSARADAGLASRIFEINGATLKAAQARHNEGYLALLQGDLLNAMQKMGEARGVLADVSPAAAVTCDMDRAEVLRDAGLISEAETLLSRAADVFGAQHMPRGRAEAQLQLAQSQLTHDSAAASHTAAAAARRFRSMGNDAWADRAEAIALRARLSGQRNGVSGFRASSMRPPSSERVMALTAALNRRGFASEAAALRLTNELWQARRSGTRRERERPFRSPASASMEVQLLTKEVRAARSTAHGRGNDARRHAADGLDLLARWQSHFGSLDLQTSIAMHGTGLMYEGLASAVRSGRPGVVFEWSERARQLSSHVAPLRPPADDAFADELAELRLLRTEDPNWAANPRVVLLRERARERQWTLTGSASTHDRVSLEQARAALNDNTALVNYVYSGEGLHALVVTASDTRLLHIKEWDRLKSALPGLRADLDMAASIRGAPLGEVIQRSLHERLALLSEILLSKVVADERIRRLVITVPGVLNGLPWAMLPAMRHRPFTLAISASRWVEATHDRPSQPASSGVAVGPRVPRGDEEAEAVAGSWVPPARVLYAATVDDVADLAAKVDVLHIAAHGRHAVDNPMFSGLELADGALFGYDIDRIPQVPDTVVLSACEGGRSSVRWGEEAIGMTRIWLHAGTRCVIAAPVIVADDDACDLLAAMHTGLAAGRPPAEALADASESTGIVTPFQAHGAGL